MKLLAVDTSSNACSVAVQHGECILQRHVVEARAHTRLLLPMISGLLQEAALEVADLDALVLGNGPGSFIGMRIGASVVQGLAFAAGRSIIPVSSLAAIAADVFSRHRAAQVAVAQDARMQQVYLGFYARGEADLPRAIGAEVICSAGEIEPPQPVRDAQWVTAGAGWQRYTDMVLAHHDVLTVSGADFPCARHLLGIAVTKFEAGEAIPPEALQPAYLRTRVATPPATSAC